MAALIGGTTLVLALLSQRRKANESYVETLERRVEDLERRVTACEQARAMLAEDNLRLMRIILAKQ